MKTFKLIVTALGLSIQSICADTNGVSLALHFPHTELLVGEWYDYSITLSNGSPHAVQIMRDTHSMLECQFVFDLGTKKKYHRGYYDFDDGWDKQRAFGRSRGNAVPLPAGEAYTWNIRWGYSQLDGANELFGVTNMSVRCLLGTNEWVHSNTVSLSFHSGDDKTVMFEPPDDGKIQSGKGIDPKLYKVRVGDKFFLFNSLRQRICELPGSDPPVIRYSSGKDTIEVSFSQSKWVFLYNPKTTEVTQGQNGK
jgi:hypothetical protein